MKGRRNLLTALALIFLFVATTTFAHEGGAHVKGTVTAITADTITVKTPEGESKSVHFDQTTAFERSKVKTAVKDLKIGDRVMIDVQDAGGKLHATQVRFGVQPKNAAEKSGHNH